MYLSTVLVSLLVPLHICPTIGAAIMTPVDPNKMILDSSHESVHTTNTIVSQTAQPTVTHIVHHDAPSGLDFYTGNPSKAKL